MIDLVTLLFFYLFLTFSIIGYGKLVFIFSKENFDVGFEGLTGILILIILSYLTNFFTTHNYFHNSFIILLGFIFFLFSLKKDYKKSLNDLKLTLLIFGILFIGLLMYKNHDDFFTYHFPYSLSLVNFEKIIGIGHITSGFTTPSSIFYLNSLFYLPFIEYYLMNSGAVFIMGFSNLIFLKFIKENTNKNKFLLFLSLLSFIFTNTVFSRIAEHGTDRSALILILVITLIFLESINFSKILKNDRRLVKSYEKIILLTTLIISLKSFYLIYFILIFLWLFHFRYQIIYGSFLYKIINNRFFYISFIGVFLSILTVFLNTGCLVYPASFTCFENFQWSIDIETVKSFKSWFEQWAKAGAAPNFRVENVELYLSNLNWITGWVERYFFTKMSDFLLVIIFISCICAFVFSFKKKKIHSKKINFKLYYLFILLLCLEWFFNHPALRYGGYTIIALLFFIPLAYYLSNFENKIVYLKRNVNILLLITLLIFISKNIMRINDEYIKYGYNVFSKPFFNLDESAFRRDEQIKKIFEQNKNLLSSGYLIIKNNTGQ